jgi:hypothetical protein
MCWGSVATQLALAEVQLEVHLCELGLQQHEALREFLLGSAYKPIIEVPHLKNFGKGGADGGGYRGESCAEEKRGQGLALLDACAT